MMMTMIILMGQVLVAKLLPLQKEKSPVQLDFALAGLSIAYYRFEAHSWEY
jgi:hypothetical protein